MDVVYFSTNFCPFHLYLYTTIFLTLPTMYDIVCRCCCYMCWVSAIKIFEKSIGTFLFIGFTIFFYPLDSKWYHYIMVEANNHLKLLPPSILNIYQVFEHIDMISIRSLTQIPTLLFGLSDFGLLSHLWKSKWFNYIMVEAGSHLKLLPPSILNIYTVF